MTLRWIFDHSPDSDAKQYGVPTSHIFKPDIDTFVREIVQNASDQRLLEDQPVAVRFSVIDFEGERLTTFLRAINFDSLHPHLQSVKNAELPNISGKIAEGLAHIEGGGLRVLIVEDYATKGLTGDDTQRKSNFVALCKNTLDTDSTGPIRGGRGGSYGLGKSVLWSFSNLSSVFFTSRPSDRPDSLRVFGRCELASHDTDDPIGWSGLGFFGETLDLENGRKRSQSSLGRLADQFTRDVNADLREPSVNESQQGTSLIVPGLFDPSAEHQPEADVLCDQILKSCIRWFWPSIVPNEKRLTVEVRQIKPDGSIGYSDTTDETRIPKHLKRLAQPEETSPELSAPGTVNTRQIEIKVPKLSTGVTADNETISKGRILVTRLEDDEDIPDANTIALIRGSGMVIQHRKLQSGLFEHPVFASIEVGKAAGAGPEYEFAEQFFRSAEPEAHNEWTHQTDRVRQNYGIGARQRIIDLGNEINRAVNSMIAVQIPTSSQGPIRLSRMFSMGSSSGGPGRQRPFTVNDIEARLEGLVWHFSGKAKLTDRDFQPWQIEVSAYVNQETGRGLRLPISVESDAANADHSNPEVAQLTANQNRFTIRFRGETGLDPDMPFITTQAQLKIDIKTSLL